MASSKQNKFEVGKVPPQALDMEEAVIGALLLEKQWHDVVVPFLPEGAFYDEKHSLLFNAIKSLYLKNSPVDMLTVISELKHQGNLERAGGAYAVSAITNKVASSANVEYHSALIKQKFLQREIIRISSESMNEAYDDTSDVFASLGKMKKQLDEIDQLIVLHKKAPSFSALVDQAGADMKKRFEQAKTGVVSGVPSPIKKLDEHTGGWQNSDLIILAARPGMGKTAFALSCCKHAAKMKFHPCFFSLEMSDISLTNRVILSETNIEGWKYRMGKLDANDWDDFNDASKRLKKLPIHIFDCPSVNINYIKAQARIKQRKGECDLIVIDYLQMIEPTNKNNYNREQQVSEISRAAKGLARELLVPVILLSQLSREVEKRGGAKKPQLSDLRDSGAIEQDADMVIFPHRPDYYGISDSDGSSLEGLGQLIIAKGRNTGTAEIPFKYNTSITNFCDVDDVTEEQPLGKIGNYTQFLTNGKDDNDEPF